MRMCEDHWAQLRAEVNKIGLGSLISEGGEEATKKMVAGLTEGPSIDNFDPLLQAHNAIMSNVMHLCSANGGQASVMELMSVRPDGGEWCPLCYINQQHYEACEDPHCDFTFDNWIGHAVAEQLQLWESLKA